MVLHEPLGNPRKLEEKSTKATWVPRRQLKWGQTPTGGRAHTCFLVPVNERQGAVIKRVSPLCPRGIAKVHLEHQTTTTYTPYTKHIATLQLQQRFTPTVLEQRT